MKTAEEILEKYPNLWKLSDNTVYDIIIAMHDYAENVIDECTKESVFASTKYGGMHGLYVSKQNILSVKSKLR